jgi:hypothetical protein
MPPHPPKQSGYPSHTPQSAAIFQLHYSHPALHHVPMATPPTILSRIMYIENKSAQKTGTKGVQGPAIIARVTYSKTKRTLYYQHRKLKKVGGGFKYNHVDEDTGEQFWISGPKRNGSDGLYGHRPTPIDEDVREDYWRTIRKRPQDVARKLT